MKRVRRRRIQEEKRLPSRSTTDFHAPLLVGFSRIASRVLGARDRCGVSNYPLKQFVDVGFGFLERAVATNLKAACLGVCDHSVALFSTVGVSRFALSLSRAARNRRSSRPRRSFARFANSMGNFEFAMCVGSLAAMVACVRFDCLDRSRMMAKSGLSSNAFSNER